MAAVTRVSDPKNPEYRRFITPAQFADRFGASAADYESVLAWAQAKNLTVTPHAGRLSVNVKGATADVRAPSA